MEHIRMFLQVEMPDGSLWQVPVVVIAEHRAEYYKDEFGGDLDRSLDEDTWPLFESDDFEIEDWAANNMNWKDVKHAAKEIQKAKDPDFDEGWRNGETKIVVV